MKIYFCSDSKKKTENRMKIGIIKEGKIPVDERVPLTPKQCRWIVDNYPGVEIYVQKSNVRRIKDEEYAKEGIPLVDDLRHCDIILGVKEVPISMLIPDKTYIFFSHTIKMQEYNKPLLKAIIEKNITLIDWELMKKNNKRVIGFGYFAGFVGAYNTFFTFGIVHKQYTLKRAYQLKDKTEVLDQLKNVTFRKPLKVILTGGGKVAHGVEEILQALSFKKVTPLQFLKNHFSDNVYTQLEVTEYFRRKDGKSFNKTEFYKNGNNVDYESDFLKYASSANFWIAGHYWDSKSPYILPAHMVKHPSMMLEIIGDISCDINGPVATTIRASSISSPYYFVNKYTLKEEDTYSEDTIPVMAVDNLPCELPVDASEHFGQMFIQFVLNELLKPESEMIKKATIVKNGGLTENFLYLKKWVES